MAEMLITGATGCIGRALVVKALSEGWTVRGMARSEPPYWWPRDVRYVQASIEDGDAVSRAAAGCQAVIHLAAPAHREALSLDPDEIRRITVAGAANAARAARLGDASLVLISTIGVYGTPPPPRCDEATETRPSTPYAEAKLAAEDQVRVDHRSPIVLRCAVVYGPGDRGNVARLITAIDRGRGLIIGDGRNYKSLLYADNLADRILLCVEDAALAGTWCVADVPAISQNALAREIASVLGKTPPRSIPIWLGSSAASSIDSLRALFGLHKRGWGDAIRTLTATTVVDGSALDHRLRYQQRFSLPDALERTVASMRGVGG